MSNQSFVSRHGKKSTVDDVIDEVSVQDIPKSVITSEEKGSKKPRPNKKFPRIRVSRKVGVVLLIVILALLFTALLLADASRREYQRQTYVMKLTVKDLSSKTFSNETTARDAIFGLTSQLTTENCSENELFFVAMYPPAAQAARECRETAELHGNLVTALTEMSSLVTYLESQEKVLSGALSPPSDGAFAEIPNESMSWSKAYDDVKKIGPPTVVKNAHDALVANIQQVAGAWRELNDAQNSQNANAFTTAETKLTKAYEKLRTNGNELSAVLDAQQKAVSQSVRALQE